jgi:hypothetical protein
MVQLSDALGSLLNQLFDYQTSPVFESPLYTNIVYVRYQDNAGNQMIDFRLNRNSLTGWHLKNRPPNIQMGKLDRFFHKAERNRTIVWWLVIRWSKNKMADDYSLTRQH